MAEYKDITPFIRDLTAMKQAYDAISLDGMIRALNDAPAADVVSRATFEQVMWERDVAIQQLKDLGVGFGEKADVAPVVRCKDCRWWNHAGCAIRIVDDTDKPQANDFCSFGERGSE